MLARQTYQLSSGADLRISLMLLDNLTELLMYTAVEKQEVDRTRWGLGNYDSLPEASIDVYDFSQREAADSGKVFWTLSKSNLRSLDRDFAMKLRYLAWWGLIPSAYVPVLLRLHDYRNEVYHRDHVRQQTLQTSVEIYMHLTAELLRTSRPALIVSTPREVTERLAERLGVETVELRRWGFEVHTLIADRMTEGLAIDDASIADRLADNIETRLEGIEDGLELISDVSSAAWRRKVTSWDAMRMAQVEGPFWDEKTLNNATVPVTRAKYEAFRQQAASIRTAPNRLQAFTLFAKFEQDFEAFEKQVDELAMAADMEVQRQIDIARGK
jgi:hypothetical protein